MNERTRVLVVGVYLADRPNCAEHLIQAFSESCKCEVSQHWVALFGEPQSDLLARNTTEVSEAAGSKFVHINRVLSQLNLADYDYLVVADDDIEVPKGFLDEYIELQRELSWGIAQPARTADSQYSHRITLQEDGLKARQTHFVEIGPLFSLNSSVFGYVMPFDENAPMGWGLDYVWPVYAEKYGFSMGIVDQTPVQHRLRKPYQYYNLEKYKEKMEQYLVGKLHFSQKDAFKVVKRHLRS